MGKIHVFNLKNDKFSIAMFQKKRFADFCTDKQTRLYYG